jgi:hypothetical protein
MSDGGCVQGVAKSHEHAVHEYVVSLTMLSEIQS